MNFRHFSCEHSLFRPNRAVHKHREQPPRPDEIWDASTSIIEREGLRSANDTKAEINAKLDAAVQARLDYQKAYDQAERDLHGDSLIGEPFLQNLARAYLGQLKQQFHPSVYGQEVLMQFPDSPRVAALYNSGVRQIDELLAEYQVKSTPATDPATPARTVSPGPYADDGPFEVADEEKYAHLEHDPNLPVMDGRVVGTEKEAFETTGRRVNYRKNPTRYVTLDDQGRIQFTNREAERKITIGDLAKAKMWGDPAPTHLKITDTDGNAEIATIGVIILKRRKNEYFYPDEKRAIVKNGYKIEAYDASKEPVAKAEKQKTPDYDSPEWIRGELSFYKRKAEQYAGEAADAVDAPNAAARKKEFAKVKRYLKKVQSFIDDVRKLPDGDSKRSEMISALMAARNKIDRARMLLEAKIAVQDEGKNPRTWRAPIQRT